MMLQIRVSINSIRPNYNEYDLYVWRYFSKYDEKLYNEFLEPYVKRIHEDYACIGMRYIIHQFKKSFKVLLHLKYEVYMINQKLTMECLIKFHGF